MTERYGGPAAERIGELFWAMTILGAVILVIFCLALAYGVGHRRSPDVPLTTEGDRRGARMIVLLGAEFTQVYANRLGERRST